tara:strand:+ start:9160 stop:9597 length:438 start_codon:yes stop_codon:yes gene_type:complete
MSILPEEYSKPVTLSYFMGKVCTVLIDRLAPFQSEMTPEEATQTFTGMVNNLDGKGICITDLTSKTKNFFFYSHIVGLREEKVLDPNNPADQQEIAIIQKAMEMKAQEKPPVSKVEQMESVGKETAFVNIGDLQRLAKESKNNLK